MGIYHQSFLHTPFSVIDLETTGLSPTDSEIVEIAVVRVEANKEPEIVLDTLVKPKSKSVGATHIHGIQNSDVASAPDFEDVIPKLLEVISGSVIAAYNASFDVPFLEKSLLRAGYQLANPHLCLMWVRPLLNIGSRCKLSEACIAHGVPLDNAHRAASDALASACLLQEYQSVIAGSGSNTCFEDLCRMGTHKYLNSFELPLPIYTGATIEFKAFPREAVRQSYRS